MITVRGTQHASLLFLGFLWLFSVPAMAQVADQQSSGAQAHDDGPMMWPVVADPNVDPVVFAVSQRLGEKSITKGYHPGDVAALTKFYKGRMDSPVWIEDNSYSARARAVKSELLKADHWGLEVEHYQLPTPPTQTASAEQHATAELAFSFAVLKYARHARAGRVKPSSVTRINDFPAPVKDVATLFDELVQSTDIAVSLRGLHPKHPEFKRLRQALLKARGISTVETGALPLVHKPDNKDVAKTALPKGDDVTVGMQHRDVMVLRQRLKVEADVGSNPHYFDAPLARAVQDFQIETGLMATGTLDSNTRKRLNAKLLDADKNAEVGAHLAEADRAEGSKRPNSRKVQLILNNMERWRWLPDDMGEIYVWNNVPEFRARVFKGTKSVFSERIVVGLPSWATPSFMASMKFVIFHPSWGVPNGIKTKELLPRLKRAQPKSLFDFFGGTSGGGAAVLKAYHLTAYRNGQVVNPSSVNWSKVDIRNYSFVQPPGSKNPLGKVKFRFPNKHSVYMHDTIEPQLFAKSQRAYSHGCIRVRNPIHLAEVLLGHDKGYSPEAVRRMARSGRSVSLDQEIPVYVTYMTARIDDNGKLQTYGDIYGRDSRLARQMGRTMRFDQPKVAKPKTSTIRKRSARKKHKKKKKSASRRSSFPSSMNRAISGHYN